MLNCFQGSLKRFNPWEHFSTGSKESSNICSLDLQLPGDSVTSHVSKPVRPKTVWAVRTRQETTLEVLPYKSTQEGGFPKRSFLYEWCLGSSGVFPLTPSHIFCLAHARLSRDRCSRVAFANSFILFQKAPSAWRAQIKSAPAGTQKPQARVPSKASMLNRGGGRKEDDARRNYLSQGPATLRLTGRIRRLWRAIWELLGTKSAQPHVAHGFKDIWPTVYSRPRQMM